MRRMVAMVGLVATLASLGSRVATAAEEATEVLPDPEGTFTAVWENDTVAGTDKNYTNGIRFAWLSGTRATDGLSDFIANGLLGADGDAYVRRGFAIGHSIFTPDDIDTAEPLPNQHPYAGWLYGEYTVLIEQRDVVDRLTVQAGIVGPSAGGERLQNNVHSLIDTPLAQGWDNQIADEAGLVIAYDRKFRALAEFGAYGMGVDISPNAGITLGNVYTNARVGVTLRLGQDLRNDFGPPRIRPSLAGAGFFNPQDGASWYVFAGIEGRAVAHNIFLEGSLFRDDGIALNPKPLVADAQAGIVFQVSRLQIALTFVQRTDEFDEQMNPQRFGAISFASKF